MRNKLSSYMLMLSCVLSGALCSMPPRKPAAKAGPAPSRSVAIKRAATSASAAAAPASKIRRHQHASGSDTSTRSCDSGSQRTVCDSPHITPQTYGIATYDALFKYVLSDDRVRLSFLRTFIPDLKITASERLDDHMAPLQTLQHIRSFIHAKQTEETAKKLLGQRLFIYDAVKKKKHSEDESIKAFMQGMAVHLADLKKSFPLEQYNGTMDFVCTLEDGQRALIEMQVVPKDNWDQRALAYAAHLFGSQLRKGDDWKDLKTVIALNILGGGKDGLQHWPETPDQYARHYKVTEQLHTGGQRFIEGLEIIQYSLMNAPKSAKRAMNDWIQFLREGHKMTEADVNRGIKTEEVKQAFQRTKFDRLPPEVRRDYEAQDKDYDRYSGHTKACVDAAVAEAKAEAAAAVAEAVAEAKAEAAAAVAEAKAEAAAAVAEAEIRRAESHRIRALHTVLKMKRSGKTEADIYQTLECLGVPKPERDALMGRTLPDLEKQISDLS